MCFDHFHSLQAPRPDAPPALRATPLGAGIIGSADNVEQGRKFKGVDSGKVLNGTPDSVPIVVMSRPQQTLDCS